MARPLHAEETRGRASPAGNAVNEALERIEREDHAVKAWVCLNPLAVRKSVVSSTSSAPLAGVPFGVKDLIDVAGLPTALGLEPSEYRPAPAMRSAAAVRLLEQAGAVALGKTVTSALAFDRPGPTRNPLDPARTPGASSSGSAAAVAAGMVPLALGSQAVGSLIRPASYCGVWAFLPSGGTLSSEGSLVLSPTLDRNGVFASSATILELAGRALLKHAGESTDTEPSAGPRLALLVNDSLAARAPELCRLLRRLKDEHPAVIESMHSDIDLGAVLDAARTIAAYEFHQGVRGRLYPVALLDQRTVRSLAPAEPTADAYRGAIEFRAHLVEAWAGMAAGFDAVLLPSAAAEAPLGKLDDQDPAPAALGSLLGLPAISVPLFTGPNGLPLGCQLLGRPKTDTGLLRVAAELPNLMSS